MPKSSSAARIATAATKAALEAVEEQRDEEQDEARGGVKVSPFFANLEQEESQLDNIAVSRMGPVGEGHLGKIGPTDGEDEILKRWGGGKFKLIGRDERNRPMKHAFTTIDVAGEPKFKTKLAAQEYARMQRESNGEGGVVLEVASSKKDAGGDSQALGIKDVLVLMDRRREDADLSHKREIERLRVEGEQRERERLAAATQLREERRADEERREREARERDERDRKHAEEQTRRDREFYANMLKMGQAGHAADPMAAMTTGINLAVKLLGQNQGDGDPVAAFVKAMPEMMKHGADMFKAGGPAAAAAAGGARPAPAPAAAQAPREGRPGEVTLAGEIGKKAEKVIEHLVAQRFDVEEMLSRMFDALATARNPELDKQPPAAGTVATQAAPAAKPEPSAQPPAAPPPAAPADGVAQLPDEPAPRKGTTEPRSVTP